MHNKTYKIIKIFLLILLFLLCFELSVPQNLALFRCAVKNGPNMLNIGEKTDEFLGKIMQKCGRYLIDTGNRLNFPKAVSANFVSGTQAISSEPTQQDTSSLSAPESLIDVPIEKTIQALSGNVDISKTISIKNQTSYSVNTAAIIENGAPFAVGSGDESPQVLIIHTHGTESYTPSEAYNFAYTTNSRTTDTNYNVVRVGTKVAEILRENGINVVHDMEMYDYPEYNSSYDKAYYGIAAWLKKYPSLPIILDIHRDAVNTETGETVKLVGDVNGKKAAQIMFVVGTDECGFSHPYWEFNLKFAAMLQNNLYNISPSLVRPINLRTSRFNQHFTKGSLIVEVGTNGNTLDEALLSAEYLANAIAVTIGELK